MKEIYYFIKDLFDKRFLIYELTKRDFKSQYAASVLGIAWAFLEPLCFILILWLIFSVGMKGKVGIEYLATGFIPFNFFRKGVMEGAASIRMYSFLVKKVDFRLSILAVVKLFSNLCIFTLLTVIILAILLLRNVSPSIYWLQYFYYIICLSFLLIGITWFLSAIEPFWPDIKNITGIVLQFLFYLTPIFWRPEIIPKKMLYILKFNPLYYIVNGFRESLLFEQWFWSNLWYSLYFWGVSLTVVITGILLFKKMKPHFADVVG